MACTISASAQSTETQMATLQHGSETQVFYGADAFKQAYNAAADTLDVITLSGGEFNSPDDICKSVAIYGNGAFESETPEKQITKIANLRIMPANTTDEYGNVIPYGRRVNGVHIEGICFTNDLVIGGSSSQPPIHNLEVVKCDIQRWLYWFNKNYDCVIRQCRIKGNKNNGSLLAKNLLISNCYITSFTGFNNSSTVLIDHCVLRPATLPGNTIDYPYRFTNNISYVAFSAAAICNNNVYVGSGPLMQDENGNWSGVTNEELWTADGETGDYSDEKDFALRHPEKYIGTDGTEIGLHGGVYAWNKVPVLPRITEFEINTDEVSNGLLKVSVKAEAQTKE